MRDLSVGLHVLQLVLDEGAELLLEILAFKDGRRDDKHVQLERGGAGSWIRHG